MVRRHDRRRRSASAAGLFGGRRPAPCHGRAVGAAAGHLHRCRRARPSSPDRPLGRLRWPLARPTRIDRQPRPSERDAQPQAHRVHCRGVDDRCRPGRLHHLFAASTKASINHGVDTDFRGDYVVDSGASVDYGGVSHNLALTLAAQPGSLAVHVEPLHPGGGRTAAATIADQLGRRRVQRSCSTSNLSKGTSRPRRRRHRRSRTATPRATAGSSATQVPVALRLGKSTLTVEAIYGDGTWPGTSFIDLRVVDTLGSDILDADRLYVKTAGGDNALSRSCGRGGHR